MTPQPVPAVPQVPAGWMPVQADMDLWVTDSFSYLAQPAVLRAQLAGGQSLTGGAFNVIRMDTVLEDPYGGWSAVATGSQAAFSWLCPAGCGGWYEASLSGFTASQGSSTSSECGAVLILNGTPWQYAADSWAVPSADSGGNGLVPVPLSPGDYVQLAIIPTSSVAVPTTAGQLPAMELAWVSS